MTECPRCAGVMREGPMPCNDPAHGVTCTRFHWGRKCGYCGFIEGEKAGSKTLEKSGPRRKVLASHGWEPGA